MPVIVPLEEIQKALRTIDPLPLIEEGFVAYSAGRVVVPPVGEMIFENPPGDVHIKYGFIRDDDLFVIKVASGFYDNPKIGLPSGNGLMLLFSQKTGESRRSSSTKDISRTSERRWRAQSRQNIWRRGTSGASVS